MHRCQHKTAQLLPLGQVFVLNMNGCIFLTMSLRKASKIPVKASAAFGKKALVDVNPVSYFHTNSPL